MRSMSSLVFVVFGGLAAVGCSAGVGAEGDDAGETSDEAALRTRVEAATFKLYDEPRHVPVAGCDLYTSLELANDARGAKAVLGAALGAGSLCKIAVSPDLRTYRLSAAGTSCGSQIFTGTRRTAGGTSKIKIIDHRTRTCRDLPPARVVVEETVPGFPGAITTTSYSSDLEPAPADGCAGKSESACSAAPECEGQYGPSHCSPSGLCTADHRFKACVEKAPAVTLSGTFTATMGIGGENTGTSLRTAEGLTELTLSGALRAQFADGAKARVKGNFVTLRGVEIPTRQALRVQDVLVCPAARAINCMPPYEPGGPCDPDNRAWIEESCPGVSFLD